MVDEPSAENSEKSQSVPSKARLPRQDEAANPANPSHQVPLDNRLALSAVEARRASKAPALAQDANLPQQDAKEANLQEAPGGASAKLRVVVEARSKRARPSGETGGHTVQPWEQEDSDRTPPSSASKDAPLPEDGAPGALPARPEDTKPRFLTGGPAERSGLTSHDVGAGPEKAARPGEGNTSENAAGPPSQAIARGVGPEASTQMIKRLPGNLPEAISPDVPRPAAPQPLAPHRNVPEASRVDAQAAPSGVANHLPPEKGHARGVAATRAGLAGKPASLAVGTEETNAMADTTAGGTDRAPNAVVADAGAVVAKEEVHGVERVAVTRPPRPAEKSSEPSVAVAVGKEAPVGKNAGLVDAICRELTTLLRAVVEKAVVAAEAGENAAPARPAAPAVVRPQGPASPTPQAGQAAEPAADMAGAEVAQGEPRESEASTAEVKDANKAVEAKKPRGVEAP